ncbi:MAG: hypothetical protein K2N42_03245 [Anaeroplasmataceae bacterium]|nr:hypothetical protein [Anaeroplasmataceae bacterium]
MNIKKWIILTLNVITLIMMLVVKFAIKDAPMWIIYVLVGVIVLLMLLYRFEMTKEQQKNQEKEAEEEIKRKKELVEILEAKAHTNSTASVMYGIFTKQILEIETLIEKKNFEIEYDINKEDSFYEVVISSKDKKNKELYYLSLSIEDGEEELLLNSGDGIKTDQMKESEIIELILEDIRNF